MPLLVNKTIYSYTFGNRQTVCFEETSLGGITPLLPQENVPKNENPSAIFAKLLEDYKSNAGKIQKKYPDGLSNLKKIDLKGLGLTQLPPHLLLECKEVESLDISGNDIGFLPAQLQELPKLESLDISDNQKLQPHIPKWLGKIPNIKVTANDMDCHFIPEGFNEKNFLSNQLLPEENLAQPTSQD